MYADKELKGADLPLQGKKDPKDCQKVPAGFTPSSFQMDVGPEGECFSRLNFYKDDNCKTKPLGSFKCSQQTLKNGVDDNIRSDNVPSSRIATRVCGPPGSADGREVVAVVGLAPRHGPRGGQVVGDPVRGAPLRGQSRDGERDQGLEGLSAAAVGCGRPGVLHPAGRGTSRRVLLHPQLLQGRRMQGTRRHPQVLHAHPRRHCP
ncbi:unnamed protein product [Bemisia tabaci]|uniref:Uncharacterized protein n=1 Tax=Bemisia tabaci TaxID=7038 RepID=A0A9P0A3C1_BEMTA|nr:unnamed protein product [Bemisia tabaci]